VHNSGKDLTVPLDYMLYFYRLYELIESQDPSDVFILNGKLRQHMHMCQDEGCKCSNIANYLDESKMMRQVMDQEFLKGTRNYNSTNHLNRSIGISFRGYANTKGQDGSINETQRENNKDQDN
jgi:hypothetical protein